MVRIQDFLCIWGSNPFKEERAPLAQNERTDSRKIKAGLIPPSQNPLKPGLPSPQKDTSDFDLSSRCHSDFRCLLPCEAPASFPRRVFLLAQLLLIATLSLVPESRQEKSWAWASVLGGIKPTSLQVLLEPDAADPWGACQVLATPGLRPRCGGRDRPCQLLASSPGNSRNKCTISKGKLVERAWSRKDRNMSLLVKHRKFVAVERRGEYKGA